MAQDIVITPGGHRPRSYLHQVMPDQCVDFSHARARLLHRAQKTMIKEVTNPDLSRPQAFAAEDGWIADAFWNNDSGQPISSLKTTWEVPPQPSQDSSQLIYLFNAITRFSDDNAILQPVLQWGVSADGGGNFWAVASWYVHTSGDAFKTPLVRVSTGDTVTGVMTVISQSGGFFSYNCQFEGIAGTSLHVLNIPELLWVSQTLEAYGAATCSAYPATTHTSFRNINIQTGTVVPTVHWSTETKVTSCGQRVNVVNDSAAGGQVDIYYGPAL
jgi:hypothetical protein